VSEPAVLQVRAGDCPCPGTPHTEEKVYLEPELTLPMVTGGLGAIRGASTIPEMEGRLFNGLFPIGIRAWTFLAKSEVGDIEPADITSASIEEYLPLEKGGFELVEFAREHYMPRFGRFLGGRIATLSERGPTDDSTSPSPPSSSPPPPPSGPSSRTNGGGKRSAALAR
jgi:hypothetical protein